MAAINPVIVYLTQNKRPTRKNARDKRASLEKSLDLLFQYYNNACKHPVIIFHEGDFSPQDQQAVIKGRGEIRFQEIHFEIPDFFTPGEIPETWCTKRWGSFSLGFRHMCRFYSIQIYDYLTEMGYDWYMRMDDDSFIHSPIHYNLFEFMARNGYDYGYRADAQDVPEVTAGFGEAVLAYIKAEGIEPHFFLERFKACSRGDHLKNFVQALRGRHYAIRSNCDYDRWGYYNNFHITRLDFWKSPQVQSFLRYMDRIGGAYKYRWSDLPVQSTAVQIFLPRQKVFKFTDWTYQHASVGKHRLYYGGIYEGSDDQDSKAVKEFKMRFGRTHCPQTY